VRGRERVGIAGRVGVRVLFQVLVGVLVRRHVSEATGCNG
jgi:hypothetical protein